MMKRCRQFVNIIVLLLLVSACSLQHQKLRYREPTDVERAATIKNLERFSVQSIDIDYYIQCKARIVADKKSYSGLCQLVLTRKLDLLLTIKHPLGGTLLEVFANRSIVQVNDFSEKRYNEFAPSETEKLGIPIIKDLSIVELQSILWGRLTDQASESLGYELADNKPVKIYKRNGNLDLEVSYKRWLEYDHLSFPRLLEMNNRRNGSSIRLAVTKFQPGYVDGLMLSKHLFD